MLQQIVQQTGISQIDQAQNGFDGFQMVLKKHYDFILCDLDMPVMNGFECAQKIRALYESAEHSFFNLRQKELSTPLLIPCSALITPQVEKKALEHGFDLCVQSPLTISVLTEKILPRIGVKKPEK